MDDPGDAEWAFAPDSPLDVYEGTLYEGWEKCAESLPEFLVHNALFEAGYNATSRRYCYEVPEDLLPQLLTPMTEVAFGGWRWPSPGHRIFMGEGLVANMGPTQEDSAPFGGKPGYADIQIGSTDPTLLSYLDDIPDLNSVKAGLLG
ncbi:hypothetical protein Afil01_33680 [Actinorhabdospora filicis]|uniref:Uncharacterized protein n=2 Tax=Actinorhabdospora filicis TaxID=1785913 RepID=A0A9W6WAG0_9ACTN|nr:hypothetical protein Afil01_33680 [Actinorhabdospora filicis]